ncbi:MAG: LysM peptidoglycan-binding domain-containing protein [Candidatus Limnocylindrales bacterium]
MPDRSAPIVVSPRACPFVALDGDRDRRLDAPDPLHRCFAEQIPRARSISHQAEYCLTPTFPTCPIFQDWATRAAAEPLKPRIPPAPVPVATTAPASEVAPVGIGETDGTAVASTAGGAPSPATSAVSSAPSPATPAVDDGEALAARAAFARAIDDDLATDDVVATRPVPSYRAVPASAIAVSASATGTAAVAPAGHPDATDATDAGDPDGPDDIPVIRTMPTPRSGPAAAPATDEDWMAPPPWLRQPSGPVWVQEAVPPPDALADVGTQSVRRPRPTEPVPDVVAEAAIPMGVEPAFGTGWFGEDTTGMPPDMAPGAPAVPSARATAGTATAAPLTASPARIVEATGTGTSTQPTDPGVSAELAASRYRADAAVGLEQDELVADPRATSSPRRVPVDANASAWLGSQSQARPSTRSSTGSREWEGPRRFEAYAATQRRRPPTSLLVAGGAIAFAVLLLGVFLLPGFLMGGGAAATATPAPTELLAGVVATDAPPAPTVDPDRTARPRRTVRPQRMYSVKSGDTLIKIARRFKVSVDAITCANRIRNPNNVAVGRRLAIPPKGYRCED